MPGKVILGAQWGDEGKGKFVDLLAQEIDYVVRFQGGANAGHTIINNYGKFALHLLPSGVFHQNIANIIGPGVALDIEKLLAETEDHKKLLAEYDFLERRIESLHGYSWKKDMETMFQKFGFALEDLEKPIGEFSGGQQTKIALIQLLLQRPDILLLDEPTNHLDIAAVEWLENYLKSYENAVVIVSHDRMFLDRVIDVTYEIEYGDIKRYPGNYEIKRRSADQAGKRL